MKENGTRQIANINTILHFFCSVNRIFLVNGCIIIVSRGRASTERSLTYVDIVNT